MSSVGPSDLISASARPSSQVTSEGSHNSAKDTGKKGNLLGCVTFFTEPNNHMEGLADRPNGLISRILILHPHQFCQSPQRLLPNPSPPSRDHPFERSEWVRKDGKEGRVWMIEINGRNDVGKGMEGNLVVWLEVKLRSKGNNQRRNRGLESKTIEVGHREV